MLEPDGSPTGQVPRVMCELLVILHDAYGGRTETMMEKAFAFALFVKWARSSKALEEFADENGMSAATFKRHLTNLLGGEKRQITKKFVARHLTIAIYTHLQGRGRLTLEQLKHELAETWELQAARRHKVAIRDTVVQMETNKLIALDKFGSYVAIAGDVVTALDTIPDKVAEVAATTAIALQVGSQHEMELVAGTDSLTNVATRLDFALPADLTPEEKRQFNEEFVGAAQEVARRWEQRTRDGKRPIAHITAPIFIKHSNQRKR